MAVGRWCTTPGPRSGGRGGCGGASPTPSLVVFGHSHVPVDELGADGQRLFNPGSPTLRRRQPHHTIGQLVLDGGAIVDRATDISVWS